MKIKCFFTLVTILLYTLLSSIYYSLQGSFESNIAVQQLEDSSFSYGLSNFILEYNEFFLVNIILLAIIGFIWIPVIAKYINYKSSKEIK